jgi:predicted transcriptional regulator
MDKFKLSQDLIKRIYEDRIPEPKEIDILDNLLKDDRAKHSQKLRPLLNEVISNRDCVKVAFKLEMSDTTLRNFLKGDTENLSYDAILRIEHYLNHLTGRKISVENEDLAKRLLREKLDNLQITMNKVGADIQKNSFYFHSIEKTVTKSKLTNDEAYRIEQAKNIITNSIRELEEVKKKFEVISNTFL